MIFVPSALAVDQEPRLMLPSLTGGRIAPLALSNKRAVVLFFISHDCPISNSYAPEINRIDTKYESKGVGFFAVYTEEGTSIATERTHYKEYGFRFPAVSDQKFVLAIKVGAKITPEAVVVSSKGTVLYRGRIDDTYASLGVRRLNPTTHDLRDALDEILSGAPVKRAETAAIGCYIPVSGNR